MLGPKRLVFKKVVLKIIEKIYEMSKVIGLSTCVGICANRKIVEVIRIAWPLLLVK